jgi:retinol dehydrogenase-12
MEAGPMAGRTVLVTGATSGIGRETARALARLGACVVLGVRDAGRGREVAAGILRAGGRAEVLEIDLASFASVRAAAAAFLASHESLDVLVNNAGLAARRRRITADGQELTWQTNFLGPFLLTRLLVPALEKAAAPRIVHVSSGAHFSGRIAWEDPGLSGGYRILKAYAQSKLAQVLFTRELARRHPRIAAYAVHPGAIATNIWRAAPRPIEWLLKLVLPRAEKGARPVVRLAVDPAVAGASGAYFDRFRQARPAPAARSDVDAARLWELAESTTDAG